MSNIILTNRQSQIIRDAVMQGEFKDENEALESMLSQMESRDEHRHFHALMVRELHEAGRAAIARGEYTSIESEEDLDAFMRSFDENDTGAERLAS